MLLTCSLRYVLLAQFSLWEDEQSFFCCCCCCCFFTALLHSAIFFPMKLDYLRKITIWYLYFPMMWPSTPRLSTAMWLNTYNMLTENKKKPKKICTWLLAKTTNWNTSRTRLPKRRLLSSSFSTVAQTFCKVFSVVSVTLLLCSIALRMWYCNIVIRNSRISPDF